MIQAQSFTRSLLTREKFWPMKLSSLLVIGRSFGEEIPNCQLCKHRCLNVQAIPTSNKLNTQLGLFTSYLRKKRKYWKNEINRWTSFGKMNLKNGKCSSKSYYSFSYIFCIQNSYSYCCKSLEPKRWKIVLVPLEAEFFRRWKYKSK